MRTQPNNTHTAAPPLNMRLLFGGLWLLMFALYLPAAKAGFVSDFTGWLDQIEHRTFTDYINRTNFKVVSMYQFTQLLTWIFYQLFGINAWLWHLLFITLHVANACLLALLCGNLLRDGGVANYRNISYIGAVFFCATPYLSEVIVWEPSFHYLLGMWLLLLVMVWMQQYIYTQKRKYILLAAIAYALSTHSIEVFYITPWLILSLGLFYRWHLPDGKRLFKNLLGYFFLPLLILFLLRMVEYRVLHGDWVSRIGSETILSAQNTGLGKPAKYLFHLLFLGRFLPFTGIKDAIYTFCDSALGITLFYTLFVGDVVWSMVSYKKMGGGQRVAMLLAVWMLLSLLLVSPLWFGNMLLVVYDRYSYFAAAFLFMLVAIGIGHIPNKYLRLGVLAIVLLPNLRFSIQASRYWGKSAKVTNNLLQNLPPTNGKIIVLLNLPESIHGVPMIGAWGYSEYKLMHNLLLPTKQITDTIHEVLSYNMATPDDGAHVTVINDSTLHVTLNQWGTWWWYEGQGGHSYENEDYKLNLLDAGHLYELTLKKPAAQYALLYQVGSVWKTADMKKAGDQY